jgi:hypothetical protein
LKVFWPPASILGNGILPVEVDAVEVVVAEKRE